jgi:hypothetical protein
MYPLLVFVHVAGAIGIFVAVAIEGVALRRLAVETTSAGAGTWLNLIGWSTRMMLVTSLVTIGAGGALMGMVWHRQPWIDVTFAGIVVMAILGGGVSGRRVRQLRALLASEHGAELSGAFRQARSSGALVTSVVLRVATGLGIVALMTTKAAMAESALLLTAALIAGVAISVVVQLRKNASSASSVSLGASSGT